MPSGRAKSMRPPSDAAAAVLDQAHDRQRGHRLAGARLADDGDGLAGADRERRRRGPPSTVRSVVANSTVRSSTTRTGAAPSFGAVTGLPRRCAFQGRPAGAAGRKTAIQPPSGSAGTAGRFISSAGTGRPWPKPATRTRVRRRGRARVVARRRQRLVRIERVGALALDRARSLAAAAARSALRCAAARSARVSSRGARSARGARGSCAGRARAARRDRRARACSRRLPAAGIEALGDRDRHRLLQQPLDLGQVAAPRRARRTRSPRPRRRRGPVRPMRWM